MSPNSILSRLGATLKGAAARGKKLKAMHTSSNQRCFGIGLASVANGLPVALAAILYFGIGGCANRGEVPPVSKTEQDVYKPIVSTPANFDVALKDIQSAQAAGKMPPDIALFNTGVILAHPSNTKKDYSKALVSFKALAADYPKSALVDQSKTWIQVIEQQQKVADERQKIADERQKIAEEKRALIRERETLSLERQKQNYTNEKSRQLDLEIEKRRRKSLGK